MARRLPTIEESKFDADFEMALYDQLPRELRALINENGKTLHIWDSYNKGVSIPEIVRDIHSRAIYNACLRYAHRASGEPLNQKLFDHSYDVPKPSKKTVNLLSVL